MSVLLTVPVWGFCMGLFYLVWSFRVPLWETIPSWRHRQREYTPLSLHLEDADSEDGDVEYASTSWSRAKASPRPEWTFGLSVVWLAYLTAVVFGLYLLCTYELPIDHRFKSRVQLANRVPRRQGYGTGGALRLSSCRRDKG